MHVYIYICIYINIYIYMYHVYIFTYIYIYIVHKLVHCLIYIYILVHICIYSIYIYISYISRRICCLLVPPNFIASLRLRWSQRTGKTDARRKSESAKKRASAAVDGYRTSIIYVYICSAPPHPPNATKNLFAHWLFGVFMRSSLQEPIV